MYKKRKQKKNIIYVLSILVLIIASMCYHTKDYDLTGNENNTYNFDDLNIPEWDGLSPYIEINNNIPMFSTKNINYNIARVESYEKYSELDSLGRCGVCEAIIGKDIMPTEERGEIGIIKPTGWHTVKYPEVIEDVYLYNRCHLIGYQLTGENANEKNLITGTRYLNVSGMLPFENQIADYIRKTNNHVKYRVTPVFKDTELLARGVILEAYSIEDQGKSVKFCVYCYNIQPGISIDYSSGNSNITHQY